jgi:hypothetical protein
MNNKALDKNGNVINPAKEDGNLANIKTNTDKLDANLSTRASEATLAGVKAKTDQFAFTGDKLKVDASLTPASEFERILNGKFLDSEQVLRDTPNTTFASASEYLGVAPSAALTSDSTWNIVRVLYDANGNEYKKSIKLAVVWDNRASLVW